MATQMSSTARKIHNLLSSGAVTVTGPNQPRNMKPKVGANAVNSVHMNVINTVRCYVCDEALSSHQVQHHLLETQTAHTTTKFPHKLGQLVGEAFMVIVSGDDVICARCTNLVNYLDRLENDVERVRTTIMGLLNKKYGLSDEGGGGAAVAGTPPVKMQKLNSGVANRTPDEIQNDTSNRIRKILPQHATAVTNDIGTTITTKQTPPVGVVQQMKITTQPTTPAGGAQQTTAATGTQTLIRKITKIYKCLACDYKTSDMRLFNTHYETCKQQNFQCKNCKKIYANFGQMKQHMVREHNTPMENTCSVCHINLVNDASLRKHMEAQHATSVVVTSTTTIPASSLANPEQTVDQLNAANALVANANVNATPAQMNTSLYACNQCPFKSSDKAIFDEHFRKHLGKPKPFKCRLCSQRFETREAATSHLKQHQQQQGTSFKCGTCSLTFNKRELLNKHIELQHPQDATANNAQLQQQHQVTVQTPSNKQQQQQIHQQQQLQPQQQQSMLTTQKLLQDTINEALSENIGTPTTATVTVAAATVAAGTGVTVTTTAEPDVGNAANNIRFYSCQICSLTFLNENYYNQHMETHRRDTSKKDPNQLGGGTKLLTGPSTGGGTTIRKINTSKLNSAATALLSDGVLNAGGVSNSGSSSMSSGGVSTKANDISATLAHTNITTMTTSSALTITTQANNVGGGGNGGSVGGISTSSNNNSIQDVDIESIFEKMHSDKGDNHQAVVAGSNGSGGSVGVGTNAVNNNSTSGGLLGGSVGGGGTGENVVISSQDSSVGGITFNISIPQTSSPDQDNKKTPSAGIDMPMLDQLDEDGNKYKTNANDGNNATGDNATPSASGGPVSMPSLDDDNDAAVLQAIQEQQQQQQQQQSDAGDSDSTTVELLNQIKMDAAAAAGGEHMKDDAANQQQQQQQQEQNATDENEATMNEQQQQDHHQQQQQEQQEQQNSMDDDSAAAGNEQQQQNNDSNENATPEQLAAAGNVSSGATAVQTADGQVAIELDEAMQAQVDSGQIKFILNENGQILQLDNHILTDSEGNQILVQDPEQIQQLLQSVGVLQSGDGMDTDTLQVMTDANGQMVLVQGENNETQLIDASLLNADGQLVIQQGQDGELGEGAHVIGEDGTRIPVSVSYTADGQPIVQVQHQVLEQSGEGNDGGQQLVLEQQSGKEDGGENVTDGNMQTDEDGVPQASDGANAVTTSVTTTSSTATTAGGSGGFFSLADIMQQQQQQEQDQQEQEQQEQQQQQSSETKAAE